MATPTPEVFFVYDDSGSPLTGVAADMSFSLYATEAGAAITPPAITEIGGGAYKFTPATPPTGHGIVYLVATGHQPKFTGRYFRVEDYAADQVPDIRNLLYGNSEMKTTGGDANRQLIYGPDGTTVIARFNLFDVTGAPSIFSPIRRVLVP